MRLFPLLSMVMLVLPWSLPTHAQDVHRCETMTGETVYTDKRCEDIGAMNRLPEPSLVRGIGSGGLYRATCSRTLSDLVVQITAAIDARDVNRLAGVYYWNGVSDSAAHRVLNQLEKVVERPLVDIVPVRPQAPITDETGNLIDANADDYYPQTTPQRPIGLRLHQTLRNTATPSSTVLGLRRAYNCFWITL